MSVSYTHLRAHETKANLVCRLHSNGPAHASMLSWLLISQVQLRFYLAQLVSYFTPQTRTRQDSLVLSASAVWTRHYKFNISATSADRVQQRAIHNSTIVQCTAESSMIQHLLPRPVFRGRKWDMVLERWVDQLHQDHSVHRRFQDSLDMLLRFETRTTERRLVSKIEATG